MLKKYKPTSAGIRFRKTLVRDVDSVRPEKTLIEPLKGPAGRASGRITSRHKLRGHKKYYRIIDFKRNKLDVFGNVSTIEYDPNRGASIALVIYTDGEKRYIIAPEGLKRGDKVISATTEAELTVGNSLKLKYMPLGAQVHNLETNPGQGGTMARGAGNYAIITAKEGSYVSVKLPSGEVKKVLGECRATIGVVGNSDLRNTQLGKAGLARHKGVRPHIRGVAIANPSDHPHGGSYKHSGVGLKSPKTPWGKIARGVKTRRRRNKSSRLIVTPRKR